MAQAIFKKRYRFTKGSESFEPNVINKTLQCPNWVVKDSFFSLLKAHGNVIVVEAVKPEPKPKPKPEPEPKPEPKKTKTKK